MSMAQSKWTTLTVKKKFKWLFLRTITSIFGQGFHMVKKCFGGWHFGECSICIDFSLGKRKQNVFLEPTSPLIRHDKTSSTRQS